MTFESSANTKSSAPAGRDGHPALHTVADVEPDHHEKARLNRLLGEAVDAYETEFGAFTEDELARARAEMGR